MSTSCSVDILCLPGSERILPEEEALAFLIERYQSGGETFLDDATRDSSAGYRSIAWRVSRWRWSEQRYSLRQFARDVKTAPPSATGQLRGEGLTEFEEADGGGRRRCPTESISPDKSALSATLRPVR